jgi:hypothetical protein
MSDSNGAMKTTSLFVSPKSQTPNPKQIQIAKSQPMARPRRALFWSLKFGASLVPGIWCLELPQRAEAQGSLTPPAGPPAPTMKSLDQIEPRCDLQNAPASVVTTTDPNHHFIMTQPGSYCLTASIAEPTNLLAFEMTSDQDRAGFFP